MPDEPEPPESSDSEAPIRRYAPRERPFEPAPAGGESQERISEHIRAFLGPVAMVYHEIVSDLVHIDVHVVAPTPQRDWFTLVTSGMSDRPMAPPPDAAGYDHAELMLCLPSTWPLSLEPWRVETFENEANYWPIRWLKILARFPHEYATWLWWGHSVPNDDPPRPFAPNTRLCGVLLSTPVLAPPEFDTLEINPEKTIHFFSVLPIYAEEIDYKLQHGADSLLDRLDRHGVSELLDIARPNVCARPRQTF